MNISPEDKAGDQLYDAQERTAKLSDESLQELARAYPLTPEDKNSDLVVIAMRVLESNGLDQTDDRVSGIIMDALKGRIDDFKSPEPQYHSKPRRHEISRDSASGDQS